VARQLSALRRAFGQTRWGRTVRRAGSRRRRVPRAHPPDPSLLRSAADAQALAAALAAKREERPGPKRKRERWRAPVKSVLLVSHTDFAGNSALHALRIASKLHERGLHPAIAVPDDPRTIDDLGRPPFPVVSYREAETLRPDLVHAFTPRERVRKLATQIVAATGCPYIVHLEDNDRAILAAELGATSEELEQLPSAVLDPLVSDGQVHPLRGPHFVKQASGVTVVIERLLELVPEELPSAVVRPGVDEALLAARRDRATARADIGLAEQDFAVVYTGTIHRANADDMRTLIAALAGLRQEGLPVVLVKTGWNAPDAPPLLEPSDAVRNLGWIPRSRLADVLAAADVLVQPGRPGPFNDYRFPAKLPDFLASGRPVILARTNLGCELCDGEQALVLDEGSPEEIARAITTLRERPELAAQIGAGGRAFALRDLRWDTSVDHLLELYGRLDEPPAAEALTLDPPVKVVLRVPDAPTADDVRLARRHGVYALEQGTAPDGRGLLRRLVLQAAVSGEPVVIAAGTEWRSRRWLRATQHAVRDGLRQYYASRGLDISARAVDKQLRATSA
jgi:glycosyltransferase involved in cell wall biosynthesis